jgi:glutamate-1-semialdehyde 2,1-aminomutase
VASPIGSAVRATDVPVIPGGYGRSALVVGPTSPRLVSGQGYEVVDENNRTLVDLNNNFTALIHGHGEPRIVAEAQTATVEGTSYGAPNNHELAHAAALLARLPHTEQVRYTNSGTEAVMIAIRVARASTGRDRILLVEDAYHGTCDAVLAARGPTRVPGIPDGVRNDTIRIPHNDVEALREAVSANADALAAVLIDLAPNKAGLVPTSAAFAAAASAETRRVGAKLIVDEVVSFRHAYGGYQASYDLEPDITVLGKLIGGGFPIGAIVGTAEQLNVLDPFGPRPIEHGGTFAANPISMRAGRVSLDLYDRDAVERLNGLGGFAHTTLAPYVTEAKWDLRCIGSLLRPLPADGPNTATSRRLWWASYRRGLLIMPTGLASLSTVMTADVVEHAMHRLGEAVLEVASDGGGA